MVQIFLEGFLLGLGAAMPIGPVNVVIMNEAMKSYGQAVAIGFGAMSADIFYLSVVVLGLAQFLQQPAVQKTLGVIGVIVLLVLGVMLFLHRDDEPKEVAPIDFGSIAKAYGKGLMLTLTNFYTIGFWLSVIAMGSLHGNLFVLIGGMMCAIALWVTGMPWIVHKNHHRLGPKVRHWINISATVILVLFAGILVVRLF